MGKLTVVADGASPLARLVDDYLQDRRARGASPKTIRIYRDALMGVLVPFAADRGVQEVGGVSARLLNDLGAGLLDGTASRSGRALSKDTVHSYVRAVNGFLAWSVAEGETVTAKAKAPRLGRRVLDVLSREEIQALEDAAPNERDKLLVRVLADTGARLNEVLGLTLGDLKLEGRSAFVRVHGKGDRDRLVPVRPELLRRLRRYAERTRPDADTDRIFVANRINARTGQYEALGDSGVQQMIRDLAARAGVKRRVYAHLLRHSFATNFLRKGGNPLLLQRILGHESMAMITRTYSHLTIDDANAELMRVLSISDR